jgi:hypothetical protein
LIETNAVYTEIELKSVIQKNTNDRHHLGAGVDASWGEKK